MRAISVPHLGPPTVHRRIGLDPRTCRARFRLLFIVSGTPAGNGPAGAARYSWGGPCCGSRRWSRLLADPGAAETAASRGAGPEYGRDCHHIRGRLAGGRDRHQSAPASGPGQGSAPIASTGRCTRTSPSRAPSWAARAAQSVHWRDARADHSGSVPGPGRRASRGGGLRHGAGIRPGHLGLLRGPAQPGARRVGQGRFGVGRGERRFNPLPSGDHGRGRGAWGVGSSGLRGAG